MSYIDITVSRKDFKGNDRMNNSLQTLQSGSITELKIGNNLYCSKTNRPLSPSSIKNRDVVCRDFNIFNNNRPITEDTSLEYITHLKDKYKLSTARGKKILFKALLKDNIPGLHLPENARQLNDTFDKVRLPSIDQNKTGKAISQSELDYILQSLDTKKALFVEFLYDSGSRVSEMLNCQTKDIRTTKDYAFIGIIGKGSKFRELQIPIELYYEIQKVFGIGKYFFSKGVKGKYSRQYIYEFINKLELQSGRKITPHSLRHSIATEMVKQKISLQAIAKFLGHSSITTVSKYYDHNVLSDKDYNNIIRRNKNEAII